jgi:hypothetical protein
MVALRERIDRLLELDMDELGRERPEDVEEVVQRGFAAIKSGELWVMHVRRELANCDRESDHVRAAALQEELTSSETALEAVRTRVNSLCGRARELGVGSPAPAQSARRFDGS